MQIITGITSEPKQSISIPLPDGSSFTLRMAFSPQQVGWFYDISYSTRTIAFECNGRRLVTSPNILRQFQEVIPFGISVITQGSVEPTTQTTFSDGIVTILLLDKADIALIESTIYTGSVARIATGFFAQPILVPNVVVTPSSKTITSGMVSLQGFSLYRPTGNVQSDDDPSAPWNRWPIMKYRKRVLSGSMERKDAICNLTCSFGSGEFRSIENISGENTIDDSGTLTTGANSIRRDRLNADFCDVPDTEVANSPVVGISDAGWVFQAENNGNSIPENTLTSKSITGLECGFNVTTGRYYGTATEVISEPDTVDSAINRVSFVAGSGACAYTAINGTTEPESIAPIELGACASVSLLLELSGGTPFSSVVVRLRFENTVISTSLALPDTFIDVTAALNSSGAATINFPVPQPLPDRRSCYVGFSVN